MTKELTLDQIEKYAEEVSGNWNGEDEGRAEDRAMIASDILEAVKNLRELLEELDK